MAGEAATAAAGLPGAFPAARSGEARRALRVPVSGAKSGPALWGFWGDGGRRAGLPRGAADGGGQWRRAPELCPRLSAARRARGRPPPRPRRGGGAAPRSQGPRCLPRGCSLPGRIP
ncbi:hypothetical protein Q9966_005127 [Columba livia]|nr:hypothetical protein Q9966_005127 [Columba livia]